MYARDVARDCVNEIVSEGAMFKNTFLFNSGGKPMPFVAKTVPQLQKYKLQVHSL